MEIDTNLHEKLSYGSFTQLVFWYFQKKKAKKTIPSD